MMDDKITDADVYQKLAARTANDTDQSRILTMCALGLTGESGEVADLVKKHIFHDHELDQTKLILELGDVLWYIARLSTGLGFNLSDVMQANIDKLMKRYPEGFSAEASRNRADAAATKD